MEKYAIFDFDGTIADSIAYNLDMINKVSKKFGYKALTENQMRSLSNKSLRQVINEFKIPLYKIPFLLLAVKKESKKDYLSKIRPFRGISQVLRRLKLKGCRLAIVSSANEKTIKGFLKKYRIDFFEDIVSDVSLFGKDKKIKRLVKRNKQREAIYIGDEVRDIVAARKAGIKIISVNWGFNSEKILKKENPDYIARTPEELINFI